MVDNIPLTAQEQQELLDLRRLDELERKVAGTQEGPQIIDEQHPNITFMDRALIKNFANKPEVGARYLQQKYPNMEVKQTPDGQTIVRTHGEKEYRVLDPEGFDLQDVTDIGWDIGSGAATGAATTAGATAGSVAGPVGSVAGGAAIGGAASAGAEALRQKLGQYFGLPQDVDTTDVKVAGGIGAALPVAGGLVKGAWSGVKSSAPWLAEKLTGINRNVVRDLPEYLNALKDAEKTGITDVVGDTHNSIRTGFAEARRRIGSELEAAINAAGEKVDVSKAEKPFIDLLEKLESFKGETNNPALAEKIAAAKEKVSYLFRSRTQTPEGAVLETKIPEKISAKSAFALQDDLADIAELSKTRSGPNARFSEGATRFEKQLAETARKSNDAINDELQRVTGNSDALKRQYHELMSLQRSVNSNFATPEATYNTLRTIGSKQKKLLLEKLSKIDRVAGTDTQNAARQMQVYTTYADPSAVPISVAGATSTSRTVPLSIAGASLGSLAGYKLGGGYAGAAIGGAAGAKLGNMLGSPATTRFIVERNAALNELLKKYGATAAPYAYGAGNIAAKGIWDQME
jgi:hypothetical protein